MFLSCKIAGKIVSYNGNEMKERMDMPTDILSAIQNGMSGFSKGQRLIASYITECYDKAAFMTASKLGKTVNVSESTVVRFAVELGYDGYPSMQKALQEMIRSKLTSVQRLEGASNRMSKEDIAGSILQSDVDKIRLTMDELDRQDFDESVNEILGAKHIYLLALRSSSALASFFGFYLSLMFDNVRIVNTPSTSEMFEQLVHVGPEDVVVAISFPRYSAKTAQAVRFAQDRGAGVIAITDSKAAPIAASADKVLLAKSEMVSFVDSLVAPLSLINALIVAIGQKKYGQVAETFAELERIWDEYGVYEKVHK